jgi:hypothetical protein
MTEYPIKGYFMQAKISLLVILKQKVCAMRLEIRPEDLVAKPEARLRLLRAEKSALKRQLSACCL